jgi:hypothetical protein
MTMERIVALYRDMERASRAAKALIDAGIPEDDISIERKRQGGAALPSPAERGGPGNWILDIGEYFGEAYRQGVEEGGALVVALVPDDLAQRVVDTLDRYHPLDIEERAAALADRAAEGDASVAPRRQGRVHRFKAS